MSLFFAFKNITQEQRESTIKTLITYSTPDQDFFIALVLSTVMATFGLLLDDPVIIIGSVFIAPLLYPFMALSLGFSLSDSTLISRSAKTIFRSVVLAFVVSVVVVLLFGQIGDIESSEIIARNSASLLYFFTAIIASTAATIFIVRNKRTNTALASAAISVSLIPVLSTFSIATATLNLELMRGSFLLLLINILGVIFASIILFSIFDLREKKKVAEKTVISEENRVEKEAKKAEALEKKEDYVQEKKKAQDKKEKKAEDKKEVAKEEKIEKADDPTPTTPPKPQQKPKE
ncbi:MAG: DUF389 domain-containing protein [Candidatus Campbellbacteria bacterium]|nr:DUF389 domain-containing protein [Candidatus Campbellbacteria bacterium]